MNNCNRMIKTNKNYWMKYKKLLINQLLLYIKMYNNQQNKVNKQQLYQKRKQTNLSNLIVKYLKNMMKQKNQRAYLKKEVIIMKIV